MAGTLFRLMYAPQHGRALPLRLSAVLNGIEWEDCLIKSDEFIRMQNSGVFVPRWMGLPQATLYDQPEAMDQNVGQTNALLRYIGQLKGDNEYTLYPTQNRFHCLLIDEIIDSLEDVSQLIEPSLMESDKETKLAMRKDLTDDADKLPLFFTRYEQILNDNETVRGQCGGYSVGDGLSIADLKMFSFTSLLHEKTKELHSVKLDGIRDNFLSEYPRVNAHTEMLGGNEVIKGFMETFNDIAHVFLSKGHEQELVIKYPLLRRDSRVFLKAHKYKL